MEKLKTFVKKNGKKIVVSAGIVVFAGIGGYVGYKYTDLLRATIDTEKRTNVLYEAASEGLFDQAITTTIRKLDYRIDRIKAIESHLEWANVESQIEMLKEYKNETDMLERRLLAYTKAQSEFGIIDS